MKYRKLDLIQGTPEWHQARFDHITASNTPVLFDLSPYKTRLQYFEELTERHEQQLDKFKLHLFQMGHAAEEAGREWVKKNLDLSLVPVVVESIETPELLASLDGFDESKGVIFEAKYVGAEKLKEIGSGLIPGHHTCQMQAQLRVTGAESCLYFAMDGNGNAVHHTIKPDASYGDDIARAASRFMELVRNREAPEPSERDFKTVEDPRFNQLEELHRSLKALEEQYSALEDAIKSDYANDRRVRGGAVQIVRYTQRGSIQYAKIPQLKGLDLEKYRAASSERVRITVKKGA